MRNINQQAMNNCTIVGKVLEKQFAVGTTSTGKSYERANILIRVNQTYGGKEEVSEIPVSMFATQFTNAGTTNPAYNTLQGLKSIKTVQEVGFQDASTIGFNRAEIQENNFVSRNSGNLITGFQLRGNFANTNPKMGDAAIFNVEMFILDMQDELDSEGETTGRLIIKGGIPQWGGRLDVLNFIVEAPDSVEYLQQNWQINDTVRASGRIRITQVESIKPQTDVGSWGEELLVPSTRTVRELIITAGSNSGYDEEHAYDPVEIKKAFNERKARIEQMQLDAQKANAPTPAMAANSASTTKGKYDWE